MESAPSFWRGKKVLVTSANQFMGTWLLLALDHLGAQVQGIAEVSHEMPPLFELLNVGSKVSVLYGDLREEAFLRQVLNQSQPDIVLHLGEFGRLHRESQSSVEMISRSVVGTAQLFELLRETASVRSVVVVGSDKVYQAQGAQEAFTEESPLKAHDLLPTAKLCAEFIALSYRHTYFNPAKYNKHKIAISTARIEAGVGAGDFSESSLIFQAVQSCLREEGLPLRNPQSRRPWIHVLDQVQGILKLGEALYVRGPKLAPTYNFGANEFHRVGDVVRRLMEVWQVSGAQIKDGNEESVGGESLHGQMNSEAALKDLGWTPRWTLEEILSHTVAWYKDYYQHNKIQTLSRDLEDFFR